MAESVQLQATESTSSLGKCAFETMFPSFRLSETAPPGCGTTVYLATRVPLWVPAHRDYALQGR